MKTALISVFDKTGVIELAKFLLARNYQILSTGGTYTTIVEALNQKTPDYIKRVIQISDLTGFPEILNGRVKTLHPKIYGGLLAKRDNPEHMAEIDLHGIIPIDIVVVNLYPFHRAITQKLSLLESQELIDIGGVTLIRAAAKNFQDVFILTNPADYHDFMSKLNNSENLSSDDIEQVRRNLAVKAFVCTSAYDQMIVNRLMEDDQIVYRLYRKQQPLKYGCNPHQISANLWSICPAHKNPIQIINGQLGYINLLDAINAWQLVNEVKQVLNTSCAASFKHTSPAGVGTSKQMDETLIRMYMAEKNQSTRSMTPLATAYLRARNADPMSSFGDFISLSDVCDEATASLIKREVSDGVIAPGYTMEALNILSAKKGGKYLVMQVDSSYRNEQELEFREMFGVAMSQTPNKAVVGLDVFDDTKNVVTQNKQLSPENKENMILANITLKYTQSNSVVMAMDGQVVAVAAGQQSRVDCVKLCVRKFRNWICRSHPMAIQLQFIFRQDVPVKRPDKINAIIRYVEDNFANDEEYTDWCNSLLREKPVSRLSSDVAGEWFNNWLKTRKIKPLPDDYPNWWVSELAMASDAFFPFSDSIEVAVNAGVEHIIQPGGSTADTEVIQACDESNMTMTFTGIREFTH